MGYLTLVEKILIVNPNLKLKFGFFAKEILRTCLFYFDVDKKKYIDYTEKCTDEDDDSNYVKCKSADSR